MIIKKISDKKLDNYINYNLKKSLENLKKIKNYFFFSLILFFLIAIIGYFFPIFFADRISNIINNLIEKIDGLSVLELIRFIISNNILSAFISLISGIVFGIFPVSIIIANSYILGFVAEKSVETSGLLVIWRLLPHGIFEIPAILISTSLGIRIGFLLMNDCIKKNINLNNINTFLLMVISILTFPISFPIYMIFTIIRKDLRDKLTYNLIESMRIFVFVVVPLLVVAGIIEGVLVYLVV